MPARTTVAAFDAILRHPRFAADHRPDVVLRLGEPPASKVLAQWLAASGARQVAVQAPGRWIDPDRTAEIVVAGDPARLVAALAKRLGGAAASGAPWLARWAHAEEVAQTCDRCADLRASTPPSEPAVARAGSWRRSPTARRSSCPRPCRCGIWSGSPHPEWESRSCSNRGANGIDGVVSTAVGVALARRSPTALLIGDVAVLHDTNGLLNAARRGIDLTIVVVDNDGGGIFSFLPQATDLSADVFERLFGTPHGVDVAALAAVHGVPEVAEVGDGAGVRMVRVRTNRAENVKVHDELNRAVVDACAGRALGGAVRRRVCAARIVERSEQERGGTTATRGDGRRSAPPGVQHGLSNEVSRSRRKRSGRRRRNYGRTSAPSIAANLAWVSASSASGSESRTTPTPANRRADEPLICAQRRATAHRPLPAASTQPTAPA